MTLRITIDIFSGRPNPVIELKGRAAAEALERMAPGRKLGPRQAKRPQSTLGYRGLIVDQVGARARQLPRSFRIAGGVAWDGDRAFEPADAEVEDFICGSTGPIRGLRGPRGLPQFVRKELRRYREVVVVKFPWERYPWPIRPVCPCAPLYEPTWWNDGGPRQWNNNCYNYACNYRSDTFAQPGLAAGAMYTSLSCASVKPAAVKDALIDSPAADNKCPAKGHLVALVIAPGWDFHWYRKGRNGRWTHKPGGTQVTNLDNSGAIITDPRTADRGPYTQFCTFMVVMHGHIKIK